MTTGNLLEKTIEAIPLLDRGAMAAARARQDTLTKPLGALGRLEELSILLAGMTGELTPDLSRRVVFVAAADHGVVAQGVSAYPQEVTLQMVLNFLRGGAAINVLARQMGAKVVVVDAGVAGELPPGAAVLSRKLAFGTADFSRGPAMSREHAVTIVEAGIAEALRATEAGAQLFATGDMGIGNTTAASAVTAVVCQRPPREVVGKGTGIPDERLDHKAQVIQQALDVNHPDAKDGLDVLAKVGGYEIGFLAGVILGAASLRRPVVLDGFISGAAALVALTLCPRSRDYMLASHRSQEPGHRAALRKLRRKPILDLDMRLGEGTGAVLAMPILEASVRCLKEMATFAEAGVSEKGE